MRHTVCSIFIRYPTKHGRTAVIIEIGIDIRKGNTIGIEETFEQQIIFDRVDTRNSKTISHR